MDVRGKSGGMILGNRATWFLKTSISVIFIVILATITIISLTYNTFVSMDPLETPTIRLNPAYIIGISILGIWMFLWTQKYLEKIPSRYLALGCLLIFTICGLYLAIKADPYLRIADSRSCWEAAKRLNSHVYIDLSKNFNGNGNEGGYLKAYPYQLYWVTFLRMVLHVGGTVRTLYILNLLFSVLSLVLIYGITCLVSQSNIVRNNAILIGSLYLPNLFNVLFAYSNVLGLMLFLLALFLAAKGVKGRDVYLYAAVIVMVLAYLVKNNYLIGVLAFLIALMVTKLKWWKKLAMLVLTLVTISVCNYSIERTYSHESHVRVSMNSGIPKASFVVMGLNEHQTKSGWYDSSTVESFKKSGYSPKRDTAESKQKLAGKLRLFSAQPQRALDLFKSKLVTTWGDPTFQSVWNGPLPTWGGKLKTKVMRNIYDPTGQSTTSKIIRRVSLAVLILIFTFSLYRAVLLARSKKSINEESFLTLVGMLYLVGGVVFHLIWETKSQYVYQYPMVLIPVASFGLCVFADRLKKLHLKRLFVPYN